MKITIRKWLTKLCIIMLLPVPAVASEFGGYGGLGYGYSILESNTTSDKEASTAGKIYAGARIFGPLGIEAAYYDLGKYNAGDDKIKANSITAVVNIDVHTASLFIKGGIIDWTVQDIPNNTEISGTDTTYGFGINLPLDKNVVFRTELEHFSKVGKDTPNGQIGNDMKLLSFGVSFVF